MDKTNFLAAAGGIVGDRNIEDGLVHRRYRAEKRFDTRILVSFAVVAVSLSGVGRTQPSCCFCHGFDLLGGMADATLRIAKRPPPTLRAHPFAGDGAGGSMQRRGRTARRRSTIFDGSRRRVPVMAATGADSLPTEDSPRAFDAPKEKILYNCALGRKGESRSTVANTAVGSGSVIEVLRGLDEEKDGDESSGAISKESINGTFELVFSSSVANLPLGLGEYLDGYLPNKETIMFDLEAGQMTLSVETLSFLPTIDIVGEHLSWNDATNTLQYTVKGKDKATEWKILYADETVVAGKSSATGYNILRRQRV